jgi:hypothetical protein
MYYKALHKGVTHMYAHVKLSADTAKEYSGVHDAFNEAAQYIHTKGSFTSDDLKHDKVKKLIDETYDVLKEGLTNIANEVPAEMLDKLQNDVFVFSGMKTYAQLKEASLLLLDEANNIKSFAAFQKDIETIDDTYNGNYLHAEYQHAVAASQSAAQYHNYMQDADRYNLQIRTAGDDRVRATHAILNGITLPADSDYWDDTWTPFDWGCRCIIIQVLKAKYDITDRDIADGAANKAVGSIFRYNPGKQQIVFPPKHPYYAASKQALAVVKGMEPNDENEGIDLSKIKGTITPKAAKNIMMDYASKFPENFANGLENVKFQKSKSYMMQHSITVNTRTGQKVGQSTISISTNTTRSGFNPAEEFLGGLNAIKEGKELSFNQEYSFESLWHEILHAKTQSSYYKLTDLQREHMETVNQFVARNTYPQLIEAFGGKATNQAKILDEGYGYSSWIKNFRKKLAEKGIDEKKAVEFLQPHLMKDYSNLGDKIKELFNNN